MSKSVLIALAALLVAGCGDTSPADDPRDAQIAELTRAVDDLTASNEALGKEVRRQGRQLARLDRVRVSRGGSPAGSQAEHEPELAGDSATVDAAAVASADPVEEPVGEGAMVALLETEAGRKAIEHATAREIERREQKERRLFVSYQVGRFARRAGLDERQTEELQQIWKTSMDGGVELRKEFAAIGRLPEAEREEARAKAMESMRDLGRQRRESVSRLLTDEQLQLYEKTEEEIVAGLHGGGR